MAEPLEEKEPVIQLLESELEMRLKEAREHAELETETNLKAKYEEKRETRERKKLIDFLKA